MLKKITAGSLLGFALITAPAAQADPPDGKGNNTTETRSTGAPTDPNGWGTVSSQFAITGGGLGGHASAFPTPRDGFGNVSADDGGPGTRPGDHADVADDMDNNPATDVSGDPGNAP